MVSNSYVDNNTITLVTVFSNCGSTDKQSTQKSFEKMLSLGTEFCTATTGCGFHIVINWLVQLTGGLISLVNDNHLDNSLKEILVYIYFGLFDCKQSTH